MEPLVIRNREITAKDLIFIQAVVHEYWDKDRTHISKILCQKWNWVQPNGRLKDMACRELLLTLHRKGLLDYPRPIQKAYNQRRTGPKKVKIDTTPVACIGWGSAAWAVQSREEFIGWTKPVKNKNLHFVMNNTRFLVLPWVTVKCLASKVLSLNIKRISTDWIKIYNYPLYMLETFVEQDRFKGTCYKASNWIHVGETKGTSKKGHKHLKHGKIKDVYLYPIDKNFKKRLRDDTS